MSDPIAVQPRDWRPEKWIKREAQDMKNWAKLKTSLCWGLIEYWYITGRSNLVLNVVAIRAMKNKTQIFIKEVSRSSIAVLPTSVQWALSESVSALVRYLCSKSDLGPNWANTQQYSTLKDWFCLFRAYYRSRNGSNNKRVDQKRVALNLSSISSNFFILFSLSTQIRKIKRNQSSKCNTNSGTSDRLTINCI